MSDGTFAVVLDIVGEDHVTITHSLVGPADLDLSAEEPESPFALVFRHSNGSELGRSGFHVPFETPHMPFPAFSMTVSVVRPLPKDTAAVEVCREERVLARIERTPSPPQVEKVRVGPAGEEEEPALEITWSAVDPDGDALTYAVSLSVDDGKSFVPVRAGLREQVLSVPLGRLPGSPGALFKVMASDGFNTGEAVSDPVEIPDKPPVAVILAPRSGVRLRAGDPLAARGTAFDPEAGVLAGDALQWLLIRDGDKVPLGTGEELIAKPLESGHHRVLLVATDQSGQSGTDEINIEFVDLAVSRGLQIAQVRAPDVNFLFSEDGQVEVTDSVGEIVLDPMAGAGFLQSRIWPPGDKGTPGEALTAYLYRISLTETIEGDGSSGVSALSLPFGAVEPLDYSGKGEPTEVFVVVEGGLGTVGPSGAEHLDGTITFTFDPPVRFGNGKEQGESSFFFGLASEGPPTQVTATLAGINGEHCICLATAPGFR